MANIIEKRKKPSRIQSKRLRIAEVKLKLHKGHWHQIYLYCNVEDYGRIARVCQEWKERLDDDFWKLAFEKRWSVKKIQTYAKFKQDKSWREQFLSCYRRERKPSHSRSISAQVKKKHERTGSLEKRDTTSRTRTKSQDLRRLTTNSYQQVSNEAEKYKKDLVNWLFDRYSFKPSFNLLNFLTGDPFLSILRHLNINVGPNIDECDRIKKLSIIFDLAEKHLNIPFLIDPCTFGATYNHLLLYLFLWYDKIELSSTNYNHTIQSDIRQLIDKVDDSLYNIGVLKEDLCSNAQLLYKKSRHILPGLNPHGPVLTGGIPKNMDGESAPDLFDDLMNETLFTLEDLEKKNQLLLKKNMYLNEKLTIMKECRVLEESARKKGEAQLAMEEEIKLICEVLAERGIDKPEN